MFPLGLRLASNGMQARTNLSKSVLSKRMIESDMQ